MNQFAAQMHKKTFYWFRYFLFVLLFTILCASLLIHYFEYNRLGKLFSPDFTIPDPEAVAIHRPHISRTRPFPEHPQKRIIKYYNNLGFIKYDSTTVEKKPGIKRILITGDSHTDGMVSNTENFCTLLQDTLTRLQNTFELLNAGTGCYSFKNYQGLLNHYLYLQPDEYIVMVYAGNDFIENIMYDYHWYNPVQSLRQFRARLGWRYQYPLMYNNQSLTQVLYFSMYPHQIKQALQKAADALFTIDSVCKKNSIKFTVALIPTDFDLDSTYQQRIQQAYGFSRDELNINRWFSQQIADFCRQQSIVVYDLYDGMKLQKDSLYFRFDHHINLQGNQVVAQLMLPHFLK